MNMMILSVAYPQEHVLLGTVLNFYALLFEKITHFQELGVTINNIFLGGQSQGGYMATRLNKCIKQMV